eukprot:GHVP01004331.1.p1 GENE.GHVP01004331.1~~GHVP01004331.1.p1  ORF type:complete len:134 (-),score=9.37 GHVP01004331.1:869-1270(-)
MVPVLFLLLSKLAHIKQTRKQMLCHIYRLWRSELSRKSFLELIGLGVQTAAVIYFGPVFSSTSPSTSQVLADSVPTTCRCETSPPPTLNDTTTGKHTSSVSARALNSRIPLVYLQGTTYISFVSVVLSLAVLL